jgi:YD repeat-containing protein
MSAYKLMLAGAVSVVAAFGVEPRTPSRVRAAEANPHGQSPSKAALERLVFEEPLVALRQPTVKESDALARALDAYVKGGRLESLGPVEAFSRAYPSNPWQLSLLVNLGLMHRHVGRTSKAMEAWDAAWKIGKPLTDHRAVALAHRALGELLEASAGLGMELRLEGLLHEAEARPLSGPITEKYSLAKESLVYMKLGPDEAFKCGPVALAYLKATKTPHAFADPHLDKMHCTDKGTSLTMNHSWASDWGLDLQMAKRTPGAEVPVPSVLHFKTGHYAAALFSKNGRVLVQDPFLGDVWIPLSVLDEEGSGYALVPAGILPKGWSVVAADEGAGVWGRGAWGPGRPDDTRPDSILLPSSQRLKAAGTPALAIHPNLVSLHLDIVASSYVPERGPRTDLTVTYNQREYGQPQLFDYCNLGSKWTFSFMTCLKDDSTNPDFNVTLCNPGGGGLIFQSRGDGTYQPDGFTQAQLIRQPGNTYVITYLDGHKDYYEAADRAWGLRRIVLTRRQDKDGVEAKFGWDARLRLVAVTDAAGKVTSLAYEDKDPLLLTKVTDPSGKITKFQYDPQGHLVEVLNPEGVSTTFTYGPTVKDQNLSKDFLNSMRASGELIAFRGGDLLIGPSYRRWLEIQGASGTPERVEGGAGYAYEIDPEQLPQVPEIDAAWHPFDLSTRESFHWVAGQYDQGKPDYRKAHHIRWGHGPGGFSSGIPLSEMEPGKPRHWFIHAGDFWGGVFPAARTQAHPLTDEGFLKPGAHMVGVEGSVDSANLLAPVCDGNRRLTTRDYWRGPDGVLRGIRRDFDAKGRLVKEGSIVH